MVCGGPPTPALHEGPPEVGVRRHPAGLHDDVLDAVARGKLNSRHECRLADRRGLPRIRPGPEERAAHFHHVLEHGDGRHEQHVPAPKLHVRGAGGQRPREIQRPGLLLVVGADAREPRFAQRSRHASDESKKRHQRPLLSDLVLTGARHAPQQADGGTAGRHVDRQPLAHVRVLGHVSAQREAQEVRRALQRSRAHQGDFPDRPAGRDPAGRGDHLDEPVRGGHGVGPRPLHLSRDRDLEGAGDQHGEGQVEELEERLGSLDERPPRVRHGEPGDGDRAHRREVEVPLGRDDEHLARDVQPARDDHLHRVAGAQAVIGTQHEARLRGRGRRRGSARRSRGWRLRPERGGEPQREHKGPAERPLYCSQEDTAFPARPEFKPPIR